jgi:hypothetical protein
MMRLNVGIPKGYLIVAGKKEVKSVMRAAGAEIAAKARSLIRQKTGGKLRVSQPGQPPVSRTGALAASIKVRPWRDGMGVSVRDAAFYALFMEAGGSGGGNPGKLSERVMNPKTGKWKRRKKANKNWVLLPHPFLTTAFEQVANKGLADRVMRAVVDGLKFQRGI